MIRNLQGQRGLSNATKAVEYYHALFACDTSIGNQIENRIQVINDFSPTAEPGLLCSALRNGYRWRSRRNRARLKRPYEVVELDSCMLDGLSAFMRRRSNLRRQLLGTHFLLSRVNSFF
jgi:hypothetical protein